MAHTQCLRHFRCREAERLLAAARKADLLADPSAPLFWRHYHVHRDLCEQGLIEPGEWPSRRALFLLMAVLRRRRREWRERDARGEYDVRLPAVAGDEVKR
jgi:hypothetical protein